MLRRALDGVIIGAVLAAAALWTHADPFQDTWHGLGFVALAVFTALNLAAWHRAITVEEMQSKH